MPEVALNSAQTKTSLIHERRVRFTVLFGHPQDSRQGRPVRYSDAPDQMRRPDNRRPYLLAPRYVVHAALAKVWDALRAHAFSTSATIEDTLILGCVWPLAAAT